jgi:hypothetical protein
MDLTDMTPRERAAFLAGIETMRQMALTAALTLEVRDDARELRQQAAVAALQGLAEGAKDLMLGAPRCSSPVVYSDPSADLVSS